MALVDAFAQAAGVFGGRGGRRRERSESSYKREQQQESCGQAVHFSGESEPQGCGQHSIGSRTGASAANFGVWLNFGFLSIGGQTDSFRNSILLAPHFGACENASPTVQRSAACTGVYTLGAKRWNGAMIADLGATA